MNQTRRNLLKAAVAAVVFPVQAIINTTKIARILPKQIHCTANANMVSLDDLRKDDTLDQNMVKLLKPTPAEPYGISFWLK